MCMGCWTNYWPTESSRQPLRKYVVHLRMASRVFSLKLRWLLTPPHLSFFFFFFSFFFTSTHHHVFYLLSFKSVNSEHRKIMAGCSCVTLSEGKWWRPWLGFVFSAAVCRGDTVWCVPPRRAFLCRESGFSLCWTVCSRARPSSPVSCVVLCNTCQQRSQQ